MKKQILVLSFFALALAAYAQTPDTQPQKNNIVDGKRQGYWEISALMKGFTSPWTPSQVVEKGNYTNSMKTGVWTEYYQNGKVKSELTYVNNRPNGPAKTYFESGQLEEEGTWVGSRWTGDYKLYYENGNLRQSFKYNALGQRDGQQLYYHPNGKLAIDVTEKAGKEEGWKKEYNTNGELTTETFFNGGTIDASKTITHDPVKVENPNAVKAPEELGKKEDAPTIKPGDGNKTNAGTKPFDGTGPHTLYNTNMQITFTGDFKNWKLMKGEQRLYDESGKCIRVKLFEDGKYAGDGPLPVENNKK